MDYKTACALGENSSKLEMVKDLVAITSDYLETPDVSAYTSQYDTVLVCALGLINEVIESLDKLSEKHDKPEGEAAQTKKKDVA